MIPNRNTDLARRHGEYPVACTTTNSLSDVSLLVT